MSQTVRGIGVSPGSVVGPAYVLSPPSAAGAAVGSSAEERAAFDRARATAVAELQAIAAGMRADGLEEQAGILDAQGLMLEDPGFLDLVGSGIDGGKGATAAVREAADHFKAMFEALDDPYMAARAADVEDIATRLHGALRGRSEGPPLDRPSVVVAHDLHPSQTAGLDRSLVLGFSTDVGSPTSHTAILARALGIPAVVGTGDLTSRVAAGGEIALDGQEGWVIIDPDTDERAEVARRAAALLERMGRLREQRGLPAQTADGHRVVLAANIGSSGEVPAALEAGAEGVGLFRTEFLFAGAQRLPDEEEQVAAYRAVLEAMPHQTVVIRTLDIGADKPLPYLLQPPEPNPFMGVRGLRHSLVHTDLLRTQLRALLRASPAGRLAIMFPMVSELEQIRAARALLNEVQGEVGGTAEVGIMVEVPAAALVADALAREVQFMSLGTNDLVQYTLAVDRTNEQVAPLYRPLHPGVLRLIATSVDGAHRHGRWVGVCGEMAGDTLAIPLLLGLGCDELSMTPGRIPEARETIRRLSHDTCRDLAARALTCASATEVEVLAREAIDLTHR